MSRVLLTFGDERLGPSLRRFRRQAAAMQCYDRVICATPNDLADSFRRRYSAVLRPAVRGYGYFCWKPQLIHQVLESLDPGDVLHYCDVGCHLNPGGRPRLDEYFALVEQSTTGVLGFRAVPLSAAFGKFAGATPFPGWFNGAWCKADTLAYFDLEKDANFHAAPLTVATTMFFRKAPSCADVIQHWRQAFWDDFTLIDDSPSRRPNHSFFVEHRHDQALFSCVAYLYGAEAVSNGEIELPRSELGQGDWTLLQPYPIHAKRDKGMSLAARMRAGLVRRFEGWRAVV